MRAGYSLPVSLFRNPGGQSYHDPGASYYAQQTPGYDAQSNYAAPAHTAGSLPASPVPDNYPAPPPANLTPGQPNTDFTDQWVSQAATAQATGHAENPVQTPSHEPGAAMDYNPGTAMAPGSMGWHSYRQASPNGTPFHKVCHSISRSCVMQVFNYVTLFQPIMKLKPRASQILSTKKLIQMQIRKMTTRKTPENR